MKRTNHIIHIALTGIVMLAGCKSIQTTVDEVFVPTSFNEGGDSVSSAPMRWREFFPDESLAALIDSGLRNNQDVMMAAQRIRLANADVRIGKGQMLPFVSVHSTVAQRRFGLYTMDGAGNATTEIYNDQLVPTHLPDYGLGFQAGWEVDIWKRLRNKKAAAVSRYLASVEGRNWVVTNLVKEIADTYYELLALDKELEVLQESIGLQEDAFNIVSIQKESAAANELAVKQIESQLLNARSLLIDVEQNIIDHEYRLNLLLGRVSQPIIRDQEAFADGLPDQVKIGIPSDLLKYRPDIRLAEYQLLATKADLKAARAAFYPSFNITGSLGYQAFATSLLFYPQSAAYTLAGNLAAPLFNRSAIRAELERADATQVEALLNYEKSILTGIVEVEKEMATISNLERLYANKLREVDLLQQSIEISNVLFRSGRANYLEIILSQQNALNAQLDLVNVKRRQYSATLNLYKALGGGWQ